MAIKRLYDTLVGATVNVNQLVDSNTSSIIIPTGHKYYAVIGGTASIGASTGTAISVTGGTDIITDLTAYFGSTIADYLYSLETATAGAGIAKLREWGFLTDEYIPHNPGSLESVEARSHVMRGFNQWDEEWEAGLYNASGVKTSSSVYICSSNKIPVLSDTDYCITSGTFGSGISLFVCEYDADEQFIQRVSFGASSAESGYVLRSSANAKYWTFCVGGSATPVTTYNHDICINLSSDRNGEYEPYHEYSYDLGTDTLRGLFKLDSNNNLYADGDRKTSDGVITRKYGVVDLGTLNWRYVQGTSDIYRFVASFPDIVKNMGGSNVPNLLCAKYQTISPDASHIGTVGITNNIGANQVIVRDTAYTDAATFKTAMSGVMLVYELATPTTETSTPFTNPQICDPDGTEEYVTNSRIPVGHETRYQL